MKLLFDQNLSFRLCARLADIFPKSRQVRLIGLDQAGDHEIWEYARVNGFTIVTQDADFADLSALRGAPPKVIWLRCGNQPTEYVDRLIRQHVEDIAALAQDLSISCLELL
jgi:predicted nuclease of predicted toxin-antitoxin system